MNTTSRQPILKSAKVITLAERELGAFLGAVVSLFGSEQATRAADVWIAEVVSIENVLSFGTRDWRLVSVQATCRLARHFVLLRKQRTSCASDHDARVYDKAFTTDREANQLSIQCKVVDTKVASDTLVQ